MAGNKETLTQPHPCFSPWAQFQPFQTPLPPPCCVDICSSMVSSTGCFSHFFSLTLGWLGSILPFLQYVCMRRHTHVAVLRRDRLRPAQSSTSLSSERNTNQHLTTCTQYIPKDPGPKPYPAQKNCLDWVST